MVLATGVNFRGIIYLACPYTDPLAAVRESRFDAATKAAARLIQEGLIVFSPITMTHPLDRLLAGYQSTLGTDYWLEFDNAFMEVCSELAILRLLGWEESTGILREIEFFRARRRPVWFIDP